jgi:OOP family OmpA-OmpF porin
MRKYLFLLCLSLSSVAQAGYIGGGVGTTTVDIDSGGADNIDDQDNYIKIFGGTDVNKYFSVEFGYTDFGEFSAHYPFLDETDTATGDAFSISGVIKLPLNDQLSLFGRLGLHFWNAEYEADAYFFGPIHGSGDGSGNDTLTGLGVTYQINDRFSLRGEFEKYANVGEDVDISIPGFGSVEATGSDAELLGVAVFYALE